MSVLAVGWGWVGRRAVCEGQWATGGQCGPQQTPTHPLMSVLKMAPAQGSALSFILTVGHTRSLPGQLLQPTPNSASSLSLSNEKAAFKRCLFFAVTSV